MIFFFFVKKRIDNLNDFQFRLSKPNFYIHKTFAEIPISMLFCWFSSPLPLLWQGIRRYDHVRLLWLAPSLSNSFAASDSYAFYLFIFSFELGGLVAEETNRRIPKSSSEFFAFHKPPSPPLLPLWGSAHFFLV